MLMLSIANASVIQGLIAQKILWGCSFGCNHLFNFINLTMKFHNCHHASEYVCTWFLLAVVVGVVVVVAVSEKSLLFVEFCGLWLWSSIARLLLLSPCSSSSSNLRKTSLHYAKIIWVSFLCQQFFWGDVY